MSARPIRILSHAGPALSGMIGDATNILFGSISSLPVDCRSSTYGAKVRPRVGCLVCKVYRHSKSAPAASQCNLKVICVCFQLSLRENAFGRPTRRRNYISTGQLFGIEYVATAKTLILDSRRECRDKAFARQALGSFFARSWLDFPFLFPHQLTKLIDLCRYVLIVAVQTFLLFLPTRVSAPKPWRMSMEPYGFEDVSTILLFPRF